MLTAGTWWGNNDSDSAIVLHRLSYPAVRGFCVFLQDKMHRRSSCEQRERQKKRKPHRLILIFIIVCILERYSQFDNSEKRQRRFERIKVEVYCRWKTTFEHFNRVKPTVVRKELLKKISAVSDHRWGSDAFYSWMFILVQSVRNWDEWGERGNACAWSTEDTDMKVSIFLLLFQRRMIFKFSPTSSSPHGWLVFLFNWMFIFIVTSQ